MKRRFARHFDVCTVFAAMVSIALAANSSAADKVEWRTDYDSARKEASEKGRPLFLDFGTEDCFHCRRLDNTTFRDPGIIRVINEKYVPLKIDGNREPKLVQALRIQAYPTLIIAGNDGKIHGWIEGYMEANRLMEHLQRGAAQQAPDWMVRDFQDATKAMTASEYPRAVVLLKKIVDEGKDRSIQAKAKEVLVEIETQAIARFNRAKQLHEKGQTTEAIETLTDLMKQYAGTDTAQTGSKYLATLVEKPDLRQRQRARRAEELLLQAKDESKMGRYLNCLDTCEILLSAYKDFPESAEAEKLSSEIKSNPERMTTVCEAMQDRLATMYITLAETWVKKGQPEMAAACLEKVVKISPKSAAAMSARAKLEELQQLPR